MKSQISAGYIDIGLDSIGNSDIACLSRLWTSGGLAALTAALRTIYPYIIHLQA
jgi:hypothetical protein